MSRSRKQKNIVVAEDSSSETLLGSGYAKNDVAPKDAWIDFRIFLAKHLPNSDIQGESDIKPLTSGAEGNSLCLLELTPGGPIFAAEVFKKKNRIFIEPSSRITKEFHSKLIELCASPLSHSVGGYKVEISTP